MRRLMYLLFVLMLCPAGRAIAEVHTVIVLSQGDHSVYDIDPASGQVVNQFQLGGVPTDAIFSWDEKSLFVSVPEAGYVSVIDMATFKESSRLATPQMKRSPSAGAFQGGLATSWDGNQLFVAVEDGLLVFDQRLVVLNPEWKQPEKKISLPGRDGEHIQVQGTTGKLYYPFRRENQVVVIDTLTDKVLKTIPVQGGPTDVAFCIGNEAWVTAADGSISIIDTSKDEVARTIQTGGKGAGRITLAWDMRYMAASHADSGDVTLLNPMTKEVLGTVKTEKGPMAVAFAPAEKGPSNNLMKFPTTQMYVTGQSEVDVVDLTNMTVSAHQKVGQGITEELIHYKYPDAFTPPREGASKRVLETDLFDLYQNAMFIYDVSPIHEHRTDMIAIITGTGVAKIGCWDPKCPPEVVPVGEGGLPYNNTEGHEGTYTGATRGTLHQEEGGSPSPRRMIIFMPKNNYYRQTNPPKKVSMFAQNPGGFTPLAETPRSWVWNLTLIPGKPVQFPAGDYAFVYLSGGLLREVHDGAPSIINKYFNDWEWDPTAKTVEAISNRIHIVVIEFK